MSSACKDRTSLLASVKNFVAGPDITSKSVKSFFEALDTPKSLAAWILYSNGEHDQLLDLDFDVSFYDPYDHDEFHRDYLAVNFLSKMKGLKTSHNTTDRAFAKFLLFEEQCKVTNLRYGSWGSLEKLPHAAWFYSMRRKIDSILGDFDVEEFFDNSSWGPGVTTLLKGSDTSGARKYQSEIGITRDAYDLLGTSLGVAYPHWFREEHVSDSSLSMQDGNTLTTVPKNSKIDRVIAVEPGLNLYFQKGIGAMIKSRLLRRGVDLTNQSRNQDLARKGSISGSLATVDFSSASDSISRELVMRLLPERWVAVMNALRSKSGVHEGRKFYWEKFSSMGNGFTFELESLIFYAAALVTCENLSLDDRDVSVYGDDVIIPTTAYGPFREFCNELGFTINNSKSFFEGSFRESCGVHYFRGIDVKPIFLKDPLSHVFSLFKLANSVRRLAHRRNSYCGCDRRFLPVVRSVLQGLPVAARRLKVPEGYGDGGILSNFDEASPSFHRFGWQGFNCEVISERAKTRVHDSIGLLNQRLYDVMKPPLGGMGTDPLNGSVGLSSQANHNNVSLRRQTKTVVMTLFVPTWYDLGPWI